MTQQPKPPWKPIDTAPDDGTEIQVSWADNNNQRVAWRVRGLWFNLGAFYVPPDFWRELPPGPFDEPENVRLLVACKAFLEKWHRQGLDANLQLEKFDVVARDMEIAIESARPKK